jgi:ORF6N domain-containing protein
MGKDVIPINRVAEKILYLREQKVILDRDLARLYGVQTRVRNQAVKRNSGRFPSDFPSSSRAPKSKGYHSL